MTSPTPFAHRLQPLTGRDPNEKGRVASTLELLYDLTFVVAVGVGASYFAETMAAGHVSDAFIAMGFAMFGILWAWINFSWFASAFDTDDWLFRLLTMVQMIGVVILALGIPDAFASIEHGHQFDNRTMVLGYVVMRVPLIVHWLRAARDAGGALRTTALRYAIGLIIIQAAWIIFALASMSLSTALLVGAPIAVAEMALPVFAEGGTNTPWHAHHIAERYGLLAIIGLGEGVVGTVASTRDLVGSHGWTFDSISVVVAGIALTFGMWWFYFVIPFGDVLHRKRSSSFTFGYGHIVVYLAIAITGAGLHLAGLSIEHETKISQTAVVATLALAVGGYLAATVGIFDGMIARFDRLHFGILCAGLVMVAVAIGLSAAGADIAFSLFAVMLAPWACVLMYEWFGHRRVEGVLADVGHHS